MKAILKDSQKLIIKRNQNNQSKIEDSIVSIIKYLHKIKCSSEDRNLEIFPYETVQRLVEKCEYIKNSVDNINVDINYNNSIVNEKDVYSYIKGRIDKVDQEKSVYKQKKECFNIFYNKLKNIEFIN